MKSDSVRLRVHFAPIGSEVLRVVEPMIALRADVAILLTLSRTDRTRFSLGKVLELLKRNRMVAEILECDIWDTSQVVNEVGSVVNAAPNHEFLFNVSTGTRPASMAGVIAGMFWKVKPYYVAVDDQAKPVHSESDFPTMGAPKYIPTFEIPLLNKAEISALEILAGAEEAIPKRRLLSSLKDGGILGPRQKESVTMQALHGQLDSILRKLELWGFVSLEGRGKEMRIHVTEKGIEGRKMFFHVLNPRKPLQVLMGRS